MRSGGLSNITVNDNIADSNEASAQNKEHANLRTQLLALLRLPSCLCLLSIYA